MFYSDICLTLTFFYVCKTKSAERTIAGSLQLHTHIRTVGGIFDLFFQNIYHRITESLYYTKTPFEAE